MEQAFLEYGITVLHVRYVANSKRFHGGVRLTQYLPRSSMGVI